IFGLCVTPYYHSLRLPLFLTLTRRPPPSTLFPYTTLFRSAGGPGAQIKLARRAPPAHHPNGMSGALAPPGVVRGAPRPATASATDRKSTRLNSSHRTISYAVFCLKKKKRNRTRKAPRLYST